MCPDVWYRWNDRNFKEGNDSIVEIILRRMLAGVAVGCSALFQSALMIAACVLRQCFRLCHMLREQQEQAKPEVSKKTRFH